MKPLSPSKTERSSSTSLLISFTIDGGEMNWVLLSLQRFTSKETHKLLGMRTVFVCFVLFLSNCNLVQVEAFSRF